MKRLILSVVLLVMAGRAYGVDASAVDTSGNLVLRGGITADSLTITQEWTMANSETLDNASDNVVRVTATANAGQTLLQLKLESDNTGAQMANGDSFLISGIADDDNDDSVVWAQIDMEASTVANGNEDGIMRLQVADNGTLVSPLIVTTAGFTMENGDILGNETDARIRLTFDDNAIELGELSLYSSDTTANNDLLQLSFDAKDSGGGAEQFAYIDGRVVSRTDGAENGGLDLGVAVAGVATDILNLSTTAAAITGNATVSGTLDVTGAATLSSTLDADSITVDAGAGIDNQAAGALMIGAATATSIEVADAGVTTDIQGKVTILGTTGNGIDTAAGNALYIGEAAATSVLLGATDADTTVLGDLDVAARLSSGHTASYTTAGPTDNVDVGGVNTIFVDGTAALVTIGGFANGVAGQYLMLVSIDTTNGFKIENNEGGGSQDVFTSTEADVTIATKGGGMLLVCDGTSWYECD